MNIQKLRSAFKSKTNINNGMSPIKVDYEDGSPKEEAEEVVVRNTKFKMPPSIHDHHKRNAFHRDFTRESILELEKDLKKEFLEERIQ